MEQNLAPQQPNTQLITSQFKPTWIFSLPEEAIVSGTASALLEQYTARQAYVIAKGWTDRFKLIVDALREKAIAGHETTISFDGREVATVKEKALPKKYEYDDVVLLDLDRQIEELEAKKKSRQKMLQGLKEESHNPKTGETLKPAVLISAGVTLSVTLH